MAQKAKEWFQKTQYYQHHKTRRSFNSITRQDVVLERNVNGNSCYQQQKVFFENIVQMASRIKKWFLKTQYRCHQGLRVFLKTYYFNCIPADCTQHSYARIIVSITASTDNRLVDMLSVRHKRCQYVNNVVSVTDHQACASDHVTPSRLSC